MALRIYGHPASQPSRTVFWVCLLGGIPFELASTAELNLNTAGNNPRGQVPSIADDEFKLSEMAAITWYLAQKYKVSGVFPESVEQSARVHQYLHMHHSLVRLGTLHLMAPHVMKPLGPRGGGGNPFSIFQRDIISRSFAEDDPLEAGGRVVKVIAEFLEAHYFTGDSPFLCGVEAASIADLVNYSEVGQFYFANLFDFDPYPRLTRWLEAMRAVPFHDAANAYNIDLGDIATKPNTQERFQQASEKGFQSLIDSGLATR